MLLNGSSAVTVKLSATPAVMGVVNAVTVKLAIAVGLTVTAVETPRMAAFPLSLAVTVCGPEVLNVTLPPVKTPLSPALKVWLAAPNPPRNGSDEVKFAVPPEPGAELLDASSAPTG